MQICEKMPTTKSKLYAPFLVKNQNHLQKKSSEKSTNFLFDARIVGVLGLFQLKKVFSKRKNIFS